MSKVQHKKELSEVYKGWELTKSHPMLGDLAKECNYFLAEDKENKYVGKNGWVAVDDWGHIYIRKGASNFGSAQEWLWMFARALCALAIWNPKSNEIEKELTELEEKAIIINAIKLADIAKSGLNPDGFKYDVQMPNKKWEELVSYFKQNKIKEENLPPSFAGTGYKTLFSSNIDASKRSWRGRIDFEKALATGISKAAAKSISDASGRNKKISTSGEEARKRMIDAFPLLASCAMLFDIIEDEDICEKEKVSLAAVAPRALEIYINPRLKLTAKQMDFVMAHEILHAALDHLGRRKGRDPLLWNYACDFVINGWLLEMGWGEAPPIGLLYDPCYKSWSAESIYDDLIKNVRRSGRLSCLSGREGFGDMLEKQGDFTGAKEAAQRALAEGARLHNRCGRGLLPAGLEEEIKAIESPPVPWDTNLARWMSARFTPEEKQKTYARPSRRQGSTPDIPRPGKLERDSEREAFVLGVIVDTSASMDRDLLGRALGAIGSTCKSLDVDFIRLIWCDASATDEGWREPDDLWGKVRVKGRGGTVLQPAFDEFKKLAFKNEIPKTIPILLITDGYCESDLSVNGFDCAALIPAGGEKPNGVKEIFYFE